MREKRLGLHTVIPISTDRVNFNCLSTTDLLLKRERGTEEGEMEEGERERERERERENKRKKRYTDTQILQSNSSNKNAQR